MPSKLVKKYNTLYFQERNEIKLVEYIIQRDKVSIQGDKVRQKLNQTMLPKGNIRFLKSIKDQAHSDLGTNNHSPGGWYKLCSQALKSQFP